MQDRMLSISAREFQTFVANMIEQFTNLGGDAVDFLHKASSAAVEARLPVGHPPVDTEQSTQFVFDFSVMVPVLEHLARHPEGSPETLVTQVELEAMRDRLDVERYKVAYAVQAMNKVIHSRLWLTEPGRGMYTYDDERYQQEFGQALREIDAAIEPLRDISSDKKHCTTDPVRVEHNRATAFREMKHVAP